MSQSHSDMSPESPTVDQGLTKLCPTPDEAVGQTLGRYKLQEKVGEGGCGVVYVAEQSQPVRRRVALKVIKLGMDTKQVVARFEAERQALAMMDHPNIAKVLDAGATETGRPYFVMELVRGIRITEYCDQNKLATKDRLELFIKVCQAIQHAHQKGIIHRDIKPSNILVTMHDGLPVPKVIDFGIAKATVGQILTENTVYTQLQQFIGTPAYMSPEQAEMSGLDIDTRSDIYSLGVLLYELLAGSTPFDGNELMSQGIDAMRKTIREKEPVRPSTRLAALGDKELTITSRRRSVESAKLLHQLRGDLDWIVMKCLEKDRTRRYETANGLAMDIKRHLDNEPVLARPPSMGYRLQKTFRRNKLMFTTAGVGTAALLIGLVVFAVLYRKENSAYRAALAARREADFAREGESRQRQQAEAARNSEIRLRQKSEVQERAALHRAYAADMNFLQQCLDRNDLGHATEILDRYRPAQGESELRGWEWRYLWQFCQSEAIARVRKPDQDGVLFLSSSSDGRWIHFRSISDSSAAGEANSYDWSRRRSGRPPWTSTNVSELMWSPKGMMAAASVLETTNRALLLLDGATGHILQRLGRLTGQVLKWQISADGSALAILSFEQNGRRLSAWRLPDGKPIARVELFDTSGEIGVPLALSTDGTLVAYASAENLCVRDLRANRELWSAPAPDVVASVAFSPDGARLFTGGGWQQGAIRVWNARTGALMDRLEGHRFWVSPFVFLNEGNTLVSASADQTIRLWDLRTMQPSGVLRGHRSEVWSLLIHPSSGLLLSGGQNGEVLAWDLASPAVRRSHLTLTNVTDWCFQKDTSDLVCRTRSTGRVVKRSGPAFADEAKLLDLGADLSSARFSSDGNWIGCTSTGSVLQVWSLNPPRLTDEIPCPDSVVYCAALSNERHVLLSASPEKRLFRQWDLRTRQTVRSWPIPEGLVAQALSPDGRWLLLLNQNADQTLWISLETGEVRKPRIAAKLAYSIAFSADGSLVGVASEPHVAHVWAVPSFEPLADLHGHMMGAKGIAFGDFRRIATSSSGVQGVILWDREYQLDLLTLPTAASILESSAFSPDGRFYAAGDSRTLEIWAAPTFAEIATAEAKEQSDNRQP